MHPVMYFMSGVTEATNTPTCDRDPPNMGRSASLKKVIGLFSTICLGPARSDWLGVESLQRKRKILCTQQHDVVHT